LSGGRQRLHDLIPPLKIAGSAYMFHDKRTSPYTSNN
jgi:hypothetical protein